VRQAAHGQGGRLGPRGSVAWLVGLSFASGVCGLGYEVLYSRLLTTYLGDMLHVAGAVLASFLVGIGVGSLLARRAYRWLWLLEAGIGLYGMAVTFSTPELSQLLLGHVVGWSGQSAALTVAVVAALLFIPALLIGTSVPLFAHYLEQASERMRGAGFEWVYALYNVGAGMCVLGVEFAVLRALGIQLAMLLLASINLGTALCLKLAVAAPARGPSRLGSGGRGRRGLLAALAVVSALSATYQLLALRLCSSLFGPFHENFALLLALVMVGLALGTVVVRRAQLSLAGLLLGGALVLAMSWSLVGDAARLWPRLSELAGRDVVARSLAKALVVALLTLPAFTVFGATIPAALRTDERLDPGTALAVSSFGNCAGYLACVLVLLERSSMLTLLVCLCAGTLVAGLLLRLEPLRRSVLVTVVALGGLWLLVTRWPAAYLFFDHEDFLTREGLARMERSFLRQESIKRFDSELTVVTTRSGAELVSINGYVSLASSAQGKANHREIMVGLAPALYAPHRDNVLVLGTGTGITAGAAAQMFEHATVVEINPAVQHAMPRFARDNFDLARRANVRFVLQDGMSVLASSPDRYDAIISTVTSPLYFSSSKLYTVEFFELVQSRLMPGGVFAFWLDNRLSAEGLAVMLQTMASVFPACDFVFLLPSYYEAICGQRLQPHPLPLDAYPATVQSALAPFRAGLELDRFLDGVLLRPTRFRDVAWSAEVNTFDRPVLEGIMAHELVGGQRPWDVDAQLAFDLRASVFGGRPFAGNALADRCHALAVMGSGMGLPRCRQALEASPDPGWLSRLAELTEQARGKGLRGALTGPEVAAAFELLGQPERALEFLRSEEARVGPGLGLRLERLRAELSVQGDVRDEDVAELVARSPMSAEVRRLLLRVSLSRGRSADALAHLQILAKLTALTPEEAGLLPTLLQDVPEHGTSGAPAP
jgi:spermidine synthase